MKELSNYLLDLIRSDLENISSENIVNKIDDFLIQFPYSDRIAFEIPLNETKEIDFHLNYRNDRSRTKHLFLNHILNTPELKDDSWTRLKYVLQNWREDNGKYNEFITNIFFEFDHALTEKESAVPAFFAKISKEFNKEERNLLYQQLIVDLKGEDFAKHINSKLKQCVDALPENAYLGYIGLMLSRPEKAVRINIYDLKINELLPYLKNIGWQGNEIIFNDYAQWIFKNCNSVILSFDIFQNSIHPRIGLELALNENPSADLRWKYIMQQLKNKNIVTAEKMNFVLNAHKRWTPKDISWHPELMLNSFPHDYQTLDYIEFFLSHIKLVFIEEKVNAKAYFGICQSFKKTNELPYIIPTSDEAIDKGLKYILKEQNQGGFWCDYSIFGGVGDQWVTAFILNQLLEIDPNLKESNAFFLGLDALAKTKKENGWGFNQHVEPDADSTFWNILLLKKIGNENWKNLYQYFYSIYCNEDKGVGTYKKAPLKGSLPTKWDDSHLCVSAVANTINNDFDNYILENTNQDKIAYWWTSNAYTLYFSIQSGMHKSNNVFVEKLKKEIEEANRKKRKNIFHHSLLLLCGIKVNLDQEILNSLQIIILSQQQENGAWKGDAQMLKNDGTNHFVVDKNNLFTTVIATLALKKYSDECK